jgi:threonine aldolase
MRTALICMETTHNSAGGAVLPLAHMQQVHGLAREHGIPVHTDGARVFNAAAALGVDTREVAQHTDSIGFCVSKGLSAPVGSVLCGSAAFIDRARALRRMVGGNMRQAGPLAAAGILAIETMAGRLAEDHATAKRLARALHAIDPALADPDDVETNIVRVDVTTSGSTAAEWSSWLKARGVLVAPCASYALRFVTHRHIGEAEVDGAAEAFRAAWRAR